MQLHLIKTQAGNALEVGIIGAECDNNTILYFHGTGLSIHAVPWSEAWLINNGLTVVAINRPGVGNSEILDKCTIEEHVIAAKDILKKLTINAVHVLGWASGGIYAMSFAYSNKAVCKSLILVSAAPPFSDMQIGPMTLKWRIIKLINRYLPFLSVLVFRYLSRQVVADFDKTWRATINDAPEADQKVLLNPDIRKRIIRAILDFWGHNGKAMLLDIRAITEYKIDLEELVGLRVAIFHGTEDNIMSLAEARILHRQIPGSELIELNGQGHFAILQNLKSIIEFIIK